MTADYDSFCLKISAPQVMKELVAEAEEITIAALAAAAGKESYLWIDCSARNQMVLLFRRINMTLRKLLSIVALALAALGPLQAQVIPPRGAQASGEYPGYPAYQAVDNNEYTIWASGAFAPGWIDSLFYGEYTVNGVYLNAAMWPNPGYANHVVYGRTVDGGYVYLGQVGTTVYDGDWFWIPNPAPAVPFNAITVYTPIEYTSWVGWRSIYAYGAPYVPPPPPPPPLTEPLPSLSGDVVGRNLAVGEVVGAYLGHIWFWDGEKVVQAMNESQVVQFVTYDNFRSKATPWGAVHTNLASGDVRACYASTCVFPDPAYLTMPDRQNLEIRVALARRANQIQQIGGNYTLSTYTTFSPSQNPMWPR